jgi:hypothetical protein
MNRLAPIAVIALALVVTSPARAEQAPPEAKGMTPLFNGKDLTGWDGDPRLWTVKDGVIRGETNDADKKIKGNTFLILKDKPLADFELRLSFRAAATNNSGIQYRSKRVVDPKNAENRWIMQGYQHELRNEKKLPNVSGFIYDERGKRGRIILVGEKATWEGGKKNVTGQLVDQAAFEKAMKIDDWNEVVIVAKGNNVKHYLNGVQLIDFTDNDPQLALKEGLVALQLHGGKPMWVEFKDVRVAELK